MKGIKKVDTIV